MKHHNIIYRNVDTDTTPNDGATRGREGRQQGGDTYTLEIAFPAVKYVANANSCDTIALLTLTLTILMAFLFSVFGFFSFIYSFFNEYEHYSHFIAFNNIILNCFSIWFYVFYFVHKNVCKKCFYELLS